MKNARHPQMQMTSAPNGLDSTTAQNLSKYQSKLLARTAEAVSLAGYSVMAQNGQFYVLNSWGLRKAFSSMDAARIYLGGL
jgi:hypothetical protein